MKAALCLAAAIALWAPAGAQAGPISAAQGRDILGAPIQPCPLGALPDRRGRCLPGAGKRNDFSRRGDPRCSERPTRFGTQRVCRD